MVEDTVISGIVEDIIFQNSDNGYAVFNIDSDGNEIICVGIVPNVHTGECFKITGNWVVHPTYGKQLQVNLFEKTIPTTVSGIEKYLCSGVIKGIGPKTAKKIVDKFGEQTFYIIEEKPDRLVEIKGINYDKAISINRVFCEQHNIRRVMLFLQDYGISPVYAMKIYKKYKERTFDIVKTNPYKLADDISGIGFKMADKLAASAGIMPDSSYRIKAGVKYVLNQCVSEGHIYMPQYILLEKISDLLNINPEIIEGIIDELQIDKQIFKEKIDNEVVVYLSMYYYAEIAVAKKLLEISQYFSVEPKDSDEINKYITEIENESSFVLAENQRTAVVEAMTRGLLVITGGPGTGKTTTINTIIKLLIKEDNHVMLAAPTGRAAKKMTEATGMEAQTIHRLLGISFLGDTNQQQTFDKNEDNPLEADVIIIDESSMIDIMLMHSLLKAIPQGTRLILVGDVDQLPSVGAGNVLKDIIKSERLSVVRLTEIFRQAQESAIIMNAHRINKGEEPVFNDKKKDFFLVKRFSTDDIVNTIVQLVKKRLPDFTLCDPVQDIQILTPMRKSPVGVYNLNAVLQEALNPLSEGKKEKEFRNVSLREGDKVMQIKNNYNMTWKIYNQLGKVREEGLGIFNGDCGIVSDINEENELIKVIFDDGKVVIYDFTQLDELELAYAITIHKSQGSEYPVVVIPLYSGPSMLMSRNLLYTAVTRAKKLVVIVGVYDTVKKMIENNKEIKRYSSLSQRILTIHDIIF